MGVVQSGFGAGGAWAVLGDSVVAVADGHGGDVRWYTARSGRLQLTQTSTLGPTSVPVSGADIEGLERHFREEREATKAPAPALVEFEAPPRGSVAVKALFDDTGRPWVSHGPSPGGGSLWTVFTASGATAFGVQLPAGFDLMSVRGDRLYGAASSELESAAIRVYRLAVP